MGFGILFFGYFAMFAFSLSPYYFFADIVGAFIAIRAFTKLSEYNRYFRGAAAAALSFLLLCGVNAASLLFALYAQDGGVDFAVDLAKEAAACVMHVFLFLGTRGICQGAEAGKLVYKTNRNFVATMLYYAGSLAVISLSRLLGDMLPYAGAVLLLYWLVCFVLNLALIYQCFGILLPADADENEKPRSRIPFLNALSDKFDELDDKKNEYRRESMKMAMEEADRLHAEREKKKKNKRKKK